MNKKMKEACAAVADCFEANPECWTANARGLGATGSYVEPCSPAAVSWCAGRGVMAALKTDRDDSVFDALLPFAQKLGYYYASEANNIGGRLVAIKMLRMAAES